MKSHIAEFLIRFLSSREHTFPTQEEETRFLQYTVIAMVGLLTMVTFGLHNFQMGRYLLCLVIMCCIVCLIFGWSLLYQGKAQALVYRGNSFLFCCLLTYVMNIGGEENSMILWLYITPLVVFFLMGRREGVLWSSFMGVVAVLYFYGPWDWEGKHQYSLAFTIRFIVTYTLISVITYFYENFRYDYRSKLEDKNKALSKEVTERKKIQRFLRESEVKYRAIYEQAAEGILLIDHTGGIVDCNPQITAMFGYREKDLINKNVFSLFHEEDLERIPSQLGKLLQGETILIERRIRNAKGQYVLCEQSGRMIDDEMIILLYRDITERKIAEIALEKANKALDRLAHIDGLTQIANRRKFDAELKTEWQRMRREKKSLGIILSDIDFFKQYNDFYGHQMGDDCLKNAAAVLQSSVHRPADIVARYGGEEFVALLPDTDMVGCEKIAEKMRHNIRSLGIDHQASEEGFVTMSFGIASVIPSEESNIESLIGSADKALYLAKEYGRNRVCR